MTDLNNLKFLSKFRPGSSVKYEIDEKTGNWWLTDSYLRRKFIRLITDL